MTVRELTPRHELGLGSRVLDVLGASQRAAGTSSPLLLVVAGRAQLRDLAGAHLRLEREGWVIGCALVEDGATPPVSSVCLALRHSAHRAAGVVLDLRCGSTSEALTMTEQAWHAGAMTWLHVGPGAACADGDLDARQHDLHEVLGYSDLVTGELTGSSALATQQSCAAPHPLERDPAQVVRSLAGLPGPLPRSTRGTLTVVLPTLGDVSALTRCLESLGRQTLPSEHFDVIVAPACEVDLRPAVAASAHGVSVRLTTPVEPMSVEAAVARGVEEATGEYVLMLDEDSDLGPRCLEEHLDAHQAHPGSTTVVVGRQLHRPQDAVQPFVRHALKLSRPWGPDGPLRDGGQVRPSTVTIGCASLERSLALLCVPRVVGLGGVDTGLALAEVAACGDAAVVAVYAARATTSSSRSITHASLRRDQAARGVASEDLRQTTHLAVGLGSSRAHLDVRSWAGALRQAERAAQRFASEPLAILRAGRGGPGYRGIDDLDRLVGTDVSAAFALGELAAHRRWERSREGIRIVVGVDADHVLAERVLTAFSGRPGAACVLGGAAPVPAHLGDRASAVVGRSLWECWDVDFVVGAPPASWHPGMALPLWGPPPEDWAEWLCPAGGAGLLGRFFGDLSRVFATAGPRAGREDG